MRESPTIVAPPYINGPITHFDFGHQVPVSAVTAAAAANADQVTDPGKIECVVDTCKVVVDKTC